MMQLPATVEQLKSIVHRDHLDYQEFLDRKEIAESLDSQVLPELMVEKENLVQEVQKVKLDFLVALAWMV
jgi:hypothetical protein